MKTPIFPFEFVKESVEGLCARQSVRSQVIYSTVLFCLAATLLSLPLIEVDISKQSRAIIRARQKNNILVAPVYAQVKASLLREGLPAGRGDTLLVLSTDKLDEQLTGLREQQSLNASYIRDLQRLSAMETDSLKGLETSLYYQEYIQYHQKVAEQQLQVDFTQRALQRSGQLFSAGAIARVEFEQAEFDANLAQRVLHSIREQYRRNWQLELERYKKENLELQAAAQKMEREKGDYFIIAPISGTITQCDGLLAGNFVSPGQPLATISADDTLIVECFISPANIGLIREGMAVQFQVDAYNYNQWGLASGTVVQVSEDIVHDQEQPVFTVKCSLRESHLQLKNGYRGKLKKGMTLTARFSITRRSLYQLLYDKADKWLNPKLG
ncbi:MAG: HlyD family efflux transporter periplasmic adaptor subunit [Lewinellaceae bacterium]|nr:HlyD family efflux transporter periplasmic adaptor subunit [Lewinellaceae bacterium]